MKINRLYNILFLGLLTSWSLSFLFVYFLSLTDSDFRPAVWLILLIIILLFGYMRATNKIEDNSVLTRIEQALLIINIVAIVFALFTGAITSSEYWLAKDI